jgi:hypothetical protein
MKKNDDSSHRPYAYTTNSYPWNIRRVPKTANVGGHSVPHPAKHCALFVVHGMGDQEWVDTTVPLRSGFDDALEVIRIWQSKNLETETKKISNIPPPFIYEGYWANYADLQATFPEDWKFFDAREKALYNNLWSIRSYSVLRTLTWLLGQQVRILFMPKTKPFARLLYVPVQFILPLALLFTLLRAPRIITRILADVRLYARPQGMTECAIVQRIEYRVGSKFLKLLGLNWDFLPLPKKESVTASGSPFACTRVIWVAHSLGSVISYNVLSDLFHRAEELEKRGSAAQKKGVALFRRSLRRFVTLGSPLDKFAVLFPNAIRPWPEKTKNKLLETYGDTYTFEGKKKTKTEKRSWWVNFYHMLDPVSGALDHPLICTAAAPINIHSDWKSLALIPGLAHSSYWSALKVLRFILARTYGKEYLLDQEISIPSSRSSIWTVFIGYVIWALLLYGIVFAIFWFYKDILHLFGKIFTGM